MKNIISTLLLLLCCSVAGAQSLSSFKDSLMVQDTLLGSRAYVVEHDGLDSILSAISSSIQIKEINGFRVSIFVDNSQVARARAEEVRLAFKEEFPEICSYLNYKSPDFTVTVGNCSTIDEATMLWGRVKGSFDRAFIVREGINIDSLYKVPYIEELIDDLTIDVQIDSLLTGVK